ncbi:MAG: tRNA (adenosine(37)-N6)-threonylcarbamoyltransferase complex ATPase subunit type 1 TsaE [Gammaproteobacteria bacterium]|nr:tRNA (adenosine(37)-N6)-threonylcarbamoyltransferase complex ATPase subunit type 1 TsaE [Gammaproteobacteria bacterium]MCW8987403.1 tRNA (adenosine(37)-N6)-threonylcarbamoyltransferase complex ATPase subunit type 1 TsaE [Gammaproteobacteria bacterium]MCW9030998.1 tRNA (adenosine(37)-N6)-threonylcarbamoyltransferase complex ATPase subunit type 1 TsaE [Gammaproteobacteria bacterium]
MPVFLANEDATIAFGQKLAKFCPPGFNVYLYGDLGAGKTTLVRGMIQAYLPGAKVKSPTYTLVEDYDLSSSRQNPNSLSHIYHFDLYRLGDPEELEYLGGRDYFSGNAVCLVEWPQRGEGWLAEPDIEIMLKYQPDGREVELVAHSEKGRFIIQQLSVSS